MSASTGASETSPKGAGEPVLEGAASARPEPEAEALMLELSHDLMSPYCPGRTIATCPSPQARKLEEQILVQARSGQSRDEIETALVSRFPDIRGYVGRPELVWGTAVAAAIALMLLLFAARRWARGEAHPERNQAASPDAAALAGPGARRGPGGSAPTTGPGTPSRREIDALDDALDRVDEF